MSTIRSRLRLLVPGVTAFVSSACIVILGVVATRLIARNLGASLYTWTAILGVGLAGLAAGNALGGRWADRYHVRRTLAVLFGLSSAACVMVIVLNNLVGGWLWLWQVSWPTHVFVHVSLMFLLPAILLGAINPVLAKMALDRNLGAGQTVGTIYAWAAFGGLVGVFLAGFWLIPHYGNIAIIWMIGAALLGIALLYWISCWALYLWAIIFGALATMGMAPATWAQQAGVSVGLREVNDPNLVLYEDETAYSHIQVRRISERPDRRAFQQDQRSPSEIVIGDVTNLQRFHTEVFAGLTEGLAATDRPLAMLVMGAGGYAFPQYLQATWPRERVEVVEVDPGVTGAAEKAFGLARDTSIVTVHLDARSYLAQVAQEGDRDGPAKRYDFIYGDAADGAVPFHHVTKEFNEIVAQTLADDGVYMLHVTDTRENGQFLGALIGTLEQTFAHVRVIGRREERPSLTGSLVVAASSRPFDPETRLRQYNMFLPFRVLDETETTRLKERAEFLVLTDDYAPVEQLLTPVVRQGAREKLAVRHLALAQTLRQRGQLEQSALRYRQAMAVNPALSIRAYNALAGMCVKQDDLEGAVTALQAALDYQAEHELEQTAVAHVHMNLGFLLRRLGRSTEARRHLNEAAKWFRVDLQQNPHSVEVWASLAETLTLVGDRNGAAEAFEKAAELDPGNVTCYEKWAKVLELERRYDDAIAVLRRQVALLKKQGQREEAMEVSQYVELLEYEKVKQKK